MLVHIYTCSCITLIHVNLLSPSVRGTRQHNQHMRTCAERHRARVLKRPQGKWALHYSYRHLLRSTRLLNNTEVKGHYVYIDIYIYTRLRNTEDFIEFLSEIDGDVQGFCSLDVCNLYGSIPLEDINNITPGVFTVAKRFFSKYRMECELSPMSGKDFEALVRLCLTSDTVLINGKGYKQKSGLAMGNNLAPMLAIIYMNGLDKL